MPIDVSKMGQELSVLLNAGAVVNRVIDDIQSKDSIRETNERRIFEKPSLEQIVNTRNKQPLVNEVICSVLAKASNLGITTAKKASPEINRELDWLFKSQEPSTEDKAQITSHVLPVKKFTKQGQSGGQQKQPGGLPANNDPAALMQEYTATYSEYLISHDPKIRNKLEKLEEILKEKGFNRKELFNLQLISRNSTRGEIATQIREKLILRILSQGKLDKLVYERGTNDLIDRTFFNDKIGGWDFGGYNETLQGTTDRMVGEALKEIREFIPEALENAIMRRIISHDKKAEKEVDMLLKVGSESSMDVRKWAAEVWPIKKIDYGLLSFVDVPPSVTGTLVDTRAGQQSDQGQKHGFEYDQKDEKEILVNRMRALYMQRALKGGLAGYLETAFKMRKLKNGLIKLGIYTKDLDGQVQEEALILAKMKILEMLKEALLERATHYDLAGPSYQLVERKIKGLLKNADRLGMDISTIEFNSLRDSANRRIYDVSAKEMEVINELLAENQNPELEKRQAMLKKLMDRIAEETQI